METLNPVFIANLKEQFDTNVGEGGLNQAPGKPDVVLNSDKLDFNTIVQFLNYKEFSKPANDDESFKMFAKDLEIFYGLEDGDESIISKLNKTHTVFGFLKLRECLTYPTTNIEDLKRRQKLVKRIKALPENELNDIEKKLERLRELQRDIIWLLKPKSIEERKIIDSVYFYDKYIGSLNKFEEPLNIYSYFKIFLSPLYGLLSPLLMMILPYLYLRFFSNMKISFWAYVKILKISMFSDVFSFMGGSGGGRGRSRMSRYFSFFLSMIFYIQNLVNSFTISFNTNQIINILHSKMSNYREFCDKGLNLVKSLKETLFLTDLEHPNKYIRDNEFENSPSLFSNKGKVLYANKNCVNYDQLKDLLKEIGNVDFNYSLFKLTQKFDTCFPSMVETKRPMIDFSNLYHPYLESKAVKNNITMGNKYPCNAIITGPNAGGKSTMIKSIGISLLTSQTLGIAFADNLQFTPFNVLNSYLNIPDCKGKESLFEAEMHRSLEHINMCKKLPEDHRSFIIMDEIFSSTNPHEGISGAYAIARKMASFENSICVITTHFNQLTNLESEGGFKNYKIPCAYDSMKKITYPYKLMDGVSDQNIALELLATKGFDEDIINDANTISDSLSLKLDNIENLSNKNLSTSVDTINSKKKNISKLVTSTVSKEEPRVDAEPKVEISNKEEPRGDVGVEVDAEPKVEISNKEEPRGDVGVEVDAEPKVEVSSKEEINDIVDSTVSSN